MFKKDLIMACKLWIFKIRYLNSQKKGGKVLLTIPLSLFYRCKLFFFFWGGGGGWGKVLVGGGFIGFFKYDAWQE